MTPRSFQDELTICLVLDWIVNLRKSGSGKLEKTTVKFLTRIASVEVEMLSHYINDWYSGKSKFHERDELNEFVDGWGEVVEQRRECEAELREGKLCERSLIPEMKNFLLSVIPSLRDTKKVEWTYLTPDLLHRDMIHDTISANVHDDMVEIARIERRGKYRSVRWAKRVATPLADSFYALIKKKRNYLKDDDRKALIALYLKLMRVPQYRSRGGSNLRELGDVRKFSRQIEKFLDKHILLGGVGGKKADLVVMRRKMKHPFG